MLRIKDKPFYCTQLGEAYLADSLEFMRQIPAGSVNLVMTSPPFALKRKKKYGNVDAAEYVEWLYPFAEEIRRILKDDGSFVLDIGGTWNKGLPTRSLYHYEVVLRLTRKLFHLAQEFYWYNPSKLPSPAEWVTVRRIRLKDAVNTVWWLSKTAWPKATNRNVLVPYSESMKQLLTNGYKPKLRPSGWDISPKFSKNNEGAIPPNLLTIANTESNSHYLRRCRAAGLHAHPARFPAGLPEFFVKLLTDPGDIVLDPFAGSNVTGEVCERLERRWVAVDLVREYLVGSRFRFEEELQQQKLLLVKDAPARRRRARAAGAARRA
jgi:site-specific DNA-methyltransferase (cytosine-N4-specific)